MVASVVVDTTGEVGTVTGTFTKISKLHVKEGINGISLQFFNIPHKLKLLYAELTANSTRLQTSFCNVVIFSAIFLVQVAFGG